MWTGKPAVTRIFFSEQRFPRYSLGKFLEVTLQPCVWRIIAPKRLILYEDNFFISFNSQLVKEHFGNLGFSILRQTYRCDILLDTCRSNRNTGLYDRKIPRYLHMPTPTCERTSNAVYRTQISSSDPVKIKYFVRNKNVFRKYPYIVLKFDLYKSTIEFACQNESNSIFLHRRVNYDIGPRLDRRSRSPNDPNISCCISISHDAPGQTELIGACHMSIALFYQKI